MWPQAHSQLPGGRGFTANERMHDGFVTTGGDRFCKEGLARPSRDAPKQQGGVLRGSECVYVRYVAGTCDHIKKSFRFL